jgi:hypothetical protein
VPTRPIYRKKDERIRSHAVICLLEENRSHEAKIKNRTKAIAKSGAYGVFKMGKCVS